MHFNWLFSSKAYFNVCIEAHKIQMLILNQVCAGRSTWFLRIALSVNVGMHVFVCVCVSPSPRLLIVSGVMWCDIDPI